MNSRSQNPEVTICFSRRFWGYPENQIVRFRSVISSTKQIDLNTGMIPRAAGAVQARSKSHATMKQHSQVLCHNCCENQNLRTAGLSLGGESNGCCAALADAAITHPYWCVRRWASPRIPRCSVGNVKVSALSSGRTASSFSAKECGQLFLNLLADDGIANSAQFPTNYRMVKCKQHVHVGS